MTSLSQQKRIQRDSETMYVNEAGTLNRPTNTTTTNKPWTNRKHESNEHGAASFGYEDHYTVEACQQYWASYEQNMRQYGTCMLVTTGSQMLTMCTQIFRFSRQKYIFYLMCLFVFLLEFLLFKSGFNVSWSQAYCLNLFVCVSVFS